jgi:hypothetical protein
MNIQQHSIDLFWSKVIKQDGCWSFQSAKDRDGYHRFAFKIEGSNKYIHRGAHRVMLMINGHKIPPGYVVCHKCDNPSCVNPEHLFIGTPADNNLDKLLKGRAVAPKGERQANASITDDIARKIKAEAVVGWRVGYNNGSNILEVALKYGVKRELVRRIARGELYKHI